MGGTIGKAIWRGLAQAGRVARALFSDRAGNTLVIVGAALVPLTAMIGSGIDMSRAYMARERLQQACDAGALAGRRAMSAGTVDQAVIDEAKKFFRFNFPTGTDGVDGSAAFGTRGFEPVVDDLESSATTVTMTASTTVPTTVMQMFGFTTLPIAVTCYAKQDFVNTDIVLVLDTTGSMICAVSETSCTDTVEKESSKIKALRSAVLALYDELAPVQTQLTTAGLRLRYGFVPYSSGVNVGKLLRAVDTSYVASDDWSYYSRTPNYDATRTVSETYSASITTGQCDQYGVNTYPSAGQNGYSTTSGGRTWTTTYSKRDWGGNGTSDRSGTTRTCRRWKTETVTAGTNWLVSWTNQQVTYNLANYVAGNTVSLPLSTDGSNLVNVDSTVWAGCIEERATVSTITGTTTTIPSGAKDLDIDLIPTTDKTTKWKPYWPDVIYRPDNGNKPQVACPAESRRLQAWTRDNMSTYLNTLVPTGGTYHDNGMIWGARMISPGGVFGGDNPSTYNSMPVSRHVIFMTDGLIDTGPTLYSTYAMEYWNTRVTGVYSTEDDQTARHNNRFKLMCTATKNMGVSLWVVAFASALDTTLTGCASNANQASTSANSTQLNAKFVEIGKNIGSLRLTQ